MFNYQDRLYTSLHFANQVPYANIYVLNLVYLPIFWWLETQFFESKLMMKRFHVSKLQISRLWTSLSFIRNKGIDSNNTLQKRQNTDGSINEQAQPFLSRRSNKLYSSHREKKVPVCEMLESSGSLPSPMLPIL